MRRGATSAKAASPFESAWARGVAAVEASGRDPEVFYDAISLFAAACGDAADARRVWEDAGRPWLALGGATGAAEVPHPLVRLVQDADRLVQHYAAPLGLDPTVKRGAGRPVGSASAPDRARSRPAMRMVK